MKSLWKEFREFAFKGNVIDMAVGVMIGTAFSAIVTSLVSDMFMPILSIFTGSLDFTNLAVKLGTGEGAASVRYGSFLQAVLNFLLIAVCVFLFVKMVNRLKRLAPGDEEPAAPARICPYCKGALADGATRCPHCTSEV